MQDSELGEARFRKCGLGCRVEGVFSATSS